MKTLKRWFLFAIAAIAATLIVFNITPSFINGNHPWIGFGIDGAIALFWAGAIIRVCYCLFAVEQAMMFLSIVRISVGFFDCLDIVTSRNIKELPSLLDIVAANRSLFPDVVEFLIEKK